MGTAPTMSLPGRNAVIAPVPHLEVEDRPAGLAHRDGSIRLPWSGRHERPDGVLQISLFELGDN